MLDATTAAWLAAIPCALLVALAILALGPSLGSLLAPEPGEFRFLPGSAAGTTDESTEHARYLISLGGPILLALATWWLFRRQPRLPKGLVEVAVPAAQIALGALLVGCLVVQYEVTYGPIYTRVAGVEYPERYFNPLTLVVAAAIAIGLLLAVRSEAVRERVGPWLRETPAKHWAGLGAAVLVTVVWLLHAVNSDASIASVLWPVRYHLEYPFDEAFAVVNGLTPLVDFNSQYSSLWPFLGALVLTVFGETLLVYTIAMCALTALALLAIHGVLRRVTHSSLLALALFVPFVAMSCFAIGEASVNRGSFANYFGIFPLRYAGPYFVAWLVARHLDRDGGRVSAWLLFTVAGLALFNNADFGAAALGAAAAALLWGGRAADRRSLLSLAGAAVAGVITALALVSALTLISGGSLPQFGRMIEYARIFAVGGYGMLPLRSPLGLHLAIYLTYVAAIGVATVRALRGAENRVLTGMLAWSGIFGLGAAAYYMGRSHPEALRTTFSAWALAVMLLTYVSVRHLAARPERRPTVPVVAALFAFGISLVAIVQVPLPWQQVERIQAGLIPGEGSRHANPMLPVADARTRSFVASRAESRDRFVVEPGAAVAILLATGHRVADAYGVRNVSPFTGIESIRTVGQVDAVIEALREAGGNTIVMPVSLDQVGDGVEPPIGIDPAMVEQFGARGFELLTPRGLRPYDPEAGFAGAATLTWHGDTLIKMVDGRALAP